MDSLLTKLTFRHCLIKRAYSTQDFRDMAAKSRFGSCRIKSVSIGLEVTFEKV
jgi:hypothetical protein